MLRSSKMAREAEPAQIKAAPTKLKGPTCRKKNRFDMATCAVTLQRFDVPSRKLTWRKSRCSIVDTSSNGFVFALSCSFPGAYFDGKWIQGSNKWKEPKHVFLARKKIKKREAFLVERKPFQGPAMYILKPQCNHNAKGA